MATNSLQLEIETVLRNQDKVNILKLQKQTNEAFEKNKIEFIQQLIASCIKFEAKQFLEFILRLASQRGTHTIVQTLLHESQKSNITLDINSKGEGSARTALFWATAYGHTQIAKTLLELGADLTIAGKIFDSPDKSNEKETPLQLASRHTLTYKNNGKDLFELFNKYITQHKLNIGVFDLFQHRNASKLTGFNEVEFQNYINKLSDYISIQQKYILETMNNFNKTSLKWMNEVIDTKKSNNPLDDIDYLQFQYDAVRSVAEHDKHSITVENFCKTLEIFRTFSKGFGNQIFVFQATIVFFFAELIKFKKVFIESTAPFERALMSLPQNLGIQGDKMRTLKKQCKKNVFQTKQSVLENLDHLLRLVKTGSSYIILDPDAFLNFIEKYFPGDNISKLSPLGVCANQILSKTAKDDNPELQKNALSEAAFNMRQGILLYKPEINNYIVDLKQQVKTKFLENKTNITALLSYRYQESIAIEEVLNEINNVIDETLKYHFTQQKIPATNENLPFKNHLIELFNYFLVLISSTNKMMEGSSKELLCDFQTTAQYLRYTYLEQQDKITKIKPMSFEQALKEENALKERLYKEEQEKRAKRKLEKQQEIQKQALLEIENAKEKKKALEQNIHLELFFRRLFPEDEHKENVDLIQSILNREITTIKKKEFFALVKHLKIKGYESIKPDNETVEDNSLTLSLSDKSLTLHTRHGRDRKEELDPKVIKEFREMLEGIGLVDEASFLKHKQIFYAKFNSKFREAHQPMVLSQSPSSPAPSLLLSQGRSENQTVQSRQTTVPKEVKKVKGQKH